MTPEERAEEAIRRAYEAAYTPDELLEDLAIQVTETIKQAAAEAVGPVAQCRNCRHWKELKNPEDFPFFCVPDEWGICDLSSGNSGKPTMETLAFALDAEEYRAELVVNVAFGCVQWQERVE